jgi:hypothetical protein
MGNVSDRFLFLEIKKVTLCKAMEVAACVRFHVWPRNVAQVKTNMLVHCCGVFANFLMTTFLVDCGVMHHGDAAELVNNIPYLLYDALE